MFGVNWQESVGGVSWVGWVVGYVVKGKSFMLEGAFNGEKGAQNVKNLLSSAQWPAPTSKVFAKLRCSFISLQG